ncbi:MAG: hypothetical protein VW169_10765, partial [Rhodospirillaceae bacterium]
ELRYAHHAADEPVEMVNYRLVAVGKRPKLAMPDVNAESGGKEPKRRPVYIDDAVTPVDCPVYMRDDLKPGQKFDGPALVQEYASTTVIFSDDACEIADTGEMIISVGTGKK